MMLFLLSIYVFLIPIEASSVPALYLGGIKVSVVQLFEVLLLFLVLIRIAQAKWLYLDNTIKLMLGLLILWCLESMIHLFWFDINVYGYDFKRPLNFAEYAVIIFIFLNIVDDVEKARKIFFVYITSASTILVLTLGKSLGLNIPGFERSTVYFMGPFKYGVAAIFTNADGSAAWTLPLIPVLIVSFFRRYPIRLNRIVLFPMLLLTIFGVALNGSRGTLVACVGSVVTTLFLTNYFDILKENSQKLFFKIVIYTTVIVCLVSIVVYANRIFEIMLQVRQGTVEQRLIGYKVAIDLWTENILYFFFGAGKERFVNEIALVLGAKIVAHNAIIEELVADGLFGGILFVLFFFMATLISWKNVLLSKYTKDERHSILSLIMLSGLISIFFEGIAANITPTYSIWILISLTLSINNSLSWSNYYLNIPESAYSNTGRSQLQIMPS